MSTAFPPLIKLSFYLKMNNPPKQEICKNLGSSSDGVSVSHIIFVKKVGVPQNLFSKYWLLYTNSEWGKVSQILLPKVLLKTHFPAGFEVVQWTHRSLFYAHSSMFCGLPQAVHRIGAEWWLERRRTHIHPRGRVFWWKRYGNA